MIDNIKHLERLSCSGQAADKNTLVDPIAKDFPPIPNIFATEIEMYVAQNKTTRSLFEIFDSRKFSY